MHTNDESAETDAMWALISPHVDEAVSTLREKDRTAVLLRYFQNKSLKEVGQAMGTTENASQLRLARALEKMRAFLLRRQVAVSAGVLTACLSTQSVQAVPSGLTALAAAGSLQQGAAPLTVVALCKGIFHAALWTSVKSAVVCTSAAVALLSVVPAGIYLANSVSDHFSSQRIVDYSQSNQVTIVLGNKNQEFGLKQVKHYQDGATNPDMVAGSECRRVRLVPPGAYVYFAIDPTFKNTNGMDVLVTVEYFDATAGRFNLQYDSHKNHAYLPTPKEVVLERSLAWQEETFVLDSARFANAEADGADFRIHVQAPEFFVRRVTVARKPM